MQHFIEQAKKFQDKRDSYLEVLSKLKEEKKIIKKENNNNYKIINFTNIDDIPNLNIAEQYKKIPQKVIEEKGNYGVPSALLDLTTRQNLFIDHKNKLGSNLGKKTLNVPNLFQAQNSEKKERNNKYDKNIYSGDAGKNCETFLKICVQEILDLGIKINKINYDLEQFKDRRWSACLGGCNPFIFNCTKNNYVFDINAIDDCDCFPGILETKNIINMVTNENIDMRCDLFCENTKPAKKIDFLNLLESNTYKEFLEKTFSKYYDLEKLLLKEGYLINKQENLNSETKICLNLTNKEGEECMILVSDMYSPKKIYIADSLKDINKNARHEIKQISHNAYFYIKNIYEVNYETEKDFPNFVKMIDNFLNIKKNKYGFLEDGIFYNDKDIENIYNIIKKKPLVKENTKIQIYYNSDVSIIGPEINCSLLIKKGENWGFLSSKKNINLEFPTDNYLLQIVYNSETDSECHFSLQGEYHDSNKIKMDYYDNKIENIKEYEIPFNEICPKFEYKGKMTDILKLTTDFLNSIVF